MPMRSGTAQLDQQEIEAALSKCQLANLSELCAHVRWLEEAGLVVGKYTGDDSAVGFRVTMDGYRRGEAIKGERAERFAEAIQVIEDAGAYWAAELLREHAASQREPEAR